MNKIQLITDLIYFANNHLDLSDLDEIYVRNQLYQEFNTFPAETLPKPIKRDVNYFVKVFQDDLKLNSIQIAHIFDLVSPRPNLVASKFYDLKKKDAKLATNYLYNLGVNNYYIHKKDIEKNLVWTANFKNNPSITITINLSKPEKNNKDIAKLLNASKTINYPKCVICEENLGYWGNEKKAPRQNIRIIPMKLNNEDWFMHYSPYGYFKEHMILVSKRHEYMEISPRIFKILFAFLDEIPHYTIVSNADLPIVGGSILNHLHFQGGNYVFPLQKAKDLFIIKSKKYRNTKISYLDFYNSAIKLQGKDRNEIFNLACLILKTWRNYSDKDLSISPKHNTITPILRLNDKKEYELILILRCNATSTKYPDGIYHVHPEYFAIKHEGIGAIEAGGRFILPARLIRQINEVEDVVKHHLTKKVYLKKHPNLSIFDHMINTLKTHKDMSARDYINEVGRNILLNTSVFKKDENGFKHLNRFIKNIKF